MSPKVLLSLGSSPHLSLDMGHVMAHDVVTKAFTMTNTSHLRTRFKLSLETMGTKKKGRNKGGGPKTFSKLLIQGAYIHTHIHTT